MFGKHFASLYSGSMIGTGAIVFAVMGYVIANAKPDKKLGGYVELNPDLLGPILGEEPPDVTRAIEFLCSPDPKSRSPEEGGRRLVKLGPFDYRVVNFEKYRAMRNEEARREQNRLAQLRHRERQKLARQGQPVPGETAYLQAVRNGDEELAQELMDNQPYKSAVAQGEPLP